MTKKWTPDWVDNMNEDVVANDYWHYAGGGVSDYSNSIMNENIIIYLPYVNLTVQLSQFDEYPT